MPSLAADAKKEWPSARRVLEPGAALTSLRAGREEVVHQRRVERAPGAIAFTSMPAPCVSSASVSVNRTTARSSMPHRN